MASTGSTRVAAALGTFALLLFLFAQPIAATTSQPKNQGYHPGWLQQSRLASDNGTVARHPGSFGAVHSFGFDGSIYHRVSRMGTVASELGSITTWSFKPATTSAAALPGRVKCQIAFENYVRNGGGVIIYIHSGDDRVSGLARL